MPDLALKVESLGKKYVIGHNGRKGRYVAMREVIPQQISAYWRRTKNVFFGKQIIQGDTLEDLWAIKDVSFEVQQGEAIGIIGRNGAGKSTLLKILSRITEPSAGRAVISGRIASLLEVGTGFHPELTGRENIFLNGAILGMSQGEIRQKFDEIVDFAEVDTFLDTPVKRYSSGMYVRLAFAVAAHLQPDILLVDEVLAVGDAGFQKKCLGKMGKVALEGRTVLFVSHNMGAVSELCGRCLWIDNGHLRLNGPGREVIREYLNGSTVCNRHVDITQLTTERDARHTEKILNISYENVTKHHGDLPAPGDSLAFDVTLELELGKSYSLAVTIRDENGTIIYNCPSSDADFRIRCSHLAETIHVKFQDIELAPGRYFVTLWLGDSANRLIERVANCISFDVSAPFGKQYNGKGCIYRVPDWSMVVAAQTSSRICIDGFSQTAQEPQTCIAG